MKLRIRGNSVRFRLSRAEMAQLEQRGVVLDSVDFGSGGHIEYGLEVGSTDSLAASYAPDRIRVVVPAEMVQQWVRPEEVGLHGVQSLPGGGELRIHVEKDFACLSPREGDDDADSFPNPAAAGDG
jgi:hypothetical protein